MGRVAHPREDRWHRQPVALLGGVAIGLSLFTGAAVFGLGSQVPVLLGCALLMFLTGLIDDLVNLKPSTKLIVQIALGSVLLFFDYRLNWVHSVTIDSLLTLVWVVGMTNAFNLLDNMDGLCAGIALIVGAALLIDLLPGSSGTAFADVRFLALLLGATGGFLVYNINPASIFMGDSGSLLLGFSFAAVTLSSSHEGAGRSDILSIVAAPLLVLMIPIFDTTLVTVSRLLSGRSAAQGGRDHSSHRLVAIGLSERRAVAVLWLFAAIGGAIGVAVDYLNRSWVSLAALTFLVGMALFAAYLAGIRVYDENDERVREHRLTPIVIDFMYKRRVAEVLLDFCLVAISYYAAYKLRFEDPEDFMKNFAIFSRLLPLVAGDADGGVLRRRRVPRHVALLRDDGHRGRGQGRLPRRGQRAADHPLRPPVLQLLARGVRDLQRAAAAGGDAVARVVPPGRRVHPPQTAVRPARRHLRSGRRRQSRHARAPERQRAGAAAGVCR